MVHGGKEMTEMTEMTISDLTSPDQLIQDAQQYLTFHSNGNTRMIVDLNHLWMNHSIPEVIDFLKHYLHEKQKSLRNMILIDKTHRKVDELVSQMFRLHMAIRILDRKEVNLVERSQQGATKSCKIPARNKRRHSDTGKRQNKNDDGKNRHARYPAQRVA